MASKRARRSSASCNAEDFAGRAASFRRRAAAPSSFHAHPLFSVSLSPSLSSSPHSSVKTAIVSALLIFGVAVVISMLVAALMKVLFLVIRRINTPKKG